MVWCKAPIPKNSNKPQRKVTNMKKLTLILLSVLMIVTLAACGSKKCEQHAYDDCADTECNVCGETRDSMHSWKDADCDTPKTCTVCGKTEGSALGHDWQSATCTELEACKNCGAVRGDLLEHSYTVTGYDDHFHYQMCSVCGKLDEDSKTKHVLDDDYTCSCSMKYIVKTENGAENSVVVQLYNSSYKLIKEYTYVDRELTFFGEYYYDENDNLIKEERYLQDGTLDYYTLYGYDENGNETSREFYLGDGTPDGITISEYNESGDIIKVTYTFDDYENIIKYEYDEYGNLIKYDSLDNDGYGYVYQYEYDENGNLVKQSYEDSTGALEIMENEYDENGNLIKYSYDSLSAENHLVGYEKYSENGRLTETWIKFSNGNQLFHEYYADGVTCKRQTHIELGGTKTVKEFDESGRIVKETLTYADNSESILEFDENENVIKKTEIDPDGNVTVTEYN